MYIHVNWLQHYGLKQTVQQNFWKHKSKSKKKLQKFYAIAIAEGKKKCCGTQTFICILVVTTTPELTTYTKVGHNPFTN